MDRPIRDSREHRIAPWWPTGGALGVLGLLVGGCTSRELVTVGDPAPALTQGAVADASSQFSQRLSCPPDRLAARLEPRAITPPPDVAADPERLAMYTEKAAAEIAASTLVSVSGCGQSALYLCLGYDSRHHGEQVRCALAERGKLGLAISVITRIIDRVEPGGLGERLGFRAGDAIVQLDRRPIADVAELVRQLNAPWSRGHVVTVMRGGAPVDVSVPPLAP
jgi:PDZ domain